MNTGIAVATAIALTLIVLAFFLIKKRKTHLREYFSRLFPTSNFKKLSENELKQLYLNLDCWYTDIIKELKQDIIKKQPNWKLDYLMPRNQELPSKWNRLFDGSLCDCMRFAYPNCVHPRSRFSSESVKDCPTWPGLNVGKSYETVLLQAYNTNNQDKNFLKDSLTLGGKGFPSHSWIEGLAFPGEYGHPEVCGKVPNYLQQSQPGILYKADDQSEWKKLEMPYSQGPWFDSPCSDTKPCPVDFLKCVDMKSDGQFPKDQPLQGKFCLNSNYMIKENYEDCDEFPIQPCKKPSKEQLDGFHGLWLYPLRGVGMWLNIGNSIVTNTKLGYLISPNNQEYNGAGYDLEDMLKIARGGGGEQNINNQLNRLIQIIQYGYVRKGYRIGRRYIPYPEMRISDLHRHGYKGKQEREYTKARSEALNLLKQWYIMGYSGIGTEEAPNGFNYNWQKHFPIGVHFSYAAAFDNMVLALLVDKKIDTLQLVIEPQNARAGLHPAYLFETFSATPSKATKSSWNTFKDTNPNICRDMYIIDPLKDFDNYSKYGYVSGDKVDKKIPFDPSKMTLTASRVSF